MKTFFIVIGVGLLIIIAIPLMALFGVFTHAVGTAANVATAPARVINKTLETNNIISNYEWYWDAYGQYQSRQGQIRQFKGMLGDSAGEERNRVRIELAAIQQSCRDLVTRYNVNSEKTNKSIFKGREAPEKLELQTCE